MKPNKLTLNILISCSALLAITLEHLNQKMLFTIFKPLTTILILLLAVLHGNRTHKKYWTYSILALLFCLFGDILLLEDSRFIWGLVSFLLAHILFILSFTTFDRFKTDLLPLILLSSFALPYYFFLYSHLQELAIPVLVYMLVIVLMSWQGINLYRWRKERPFKLIALGTLLFLFSDSAIAYNKFIQTFSLARFLILFTYWLAIGLLANAITLDQKEEEQLTQANITP